MEDAGNTERMTTMKTDITTSYYDYGDVTEPCNNISVLNPSIMAAVFYLVFALGLLGNGIILWALLRVMHIKTMTDVCLLNLAVSDLITALSLPLWALHNQGHSLGTDGMCQLMVGTYHLGFYSGILFVTLMSVDRYLAIVHAVASLGARTLRYAITASLTIWTVSFCAAFPGALFHKMLDVDNMTQCDWDYTQGSGSVKKWKLFLNFTQNTVGLFVSLPVTIYCYVRIMLVLRRMKNSKRGRAMKLIFAIVCVFVIFWVPYNVAVFLQTLQDLEIIDTCEESRQINTTLAVTETIALVHCCVNPVIYAFVGEKFRKCLTKVFSKWLLCAKLYQPASIHSKTSDNETSNTPL